MLGHCYRGHCYSKTTLADIVYEDRKVQRFFDCHAFGYVPRLFGSRTFFLNILSQIEAQILQVPAVVHVDPQMRLRQLLEGKRYLLILDNVLSAEELECIVNALPNGLPGSKIIMTSCNSDLAPRNSECIHDLSNGLSSDEANKLFCKKAFHGDCDKCPPEIEKLAEMIINRCDGLPLAISASGTFLAQKPQTVVEWERFNNRLGSDPQIISRICQPSYIDLPSHLQFCFLYFGMFPEDYSIKRERLIRLWVAEGFVRERRGATMEEDADCYLNELIGRNLVHVSSKEIDGQVRSCRALNNLVRQFIISKPENFVTVLEANSTGATTCSTNSGEIIRRLSAHYVPINNFSSRGRDLNRTRTLLVFGSGGQQPEIPYQTYVLGELLKTLETLRVLDLKGVPLERFPKSIFGLTLLKYISMRKTKIKEVPSSIKKLTQLETLDLKRTQVTALPKEIYELYNMRHLLVSNGACDNDDGPIKGVVVAEGNIGALKLDGNIGALKDALQKLSLIKVGNNRTILRELGELIGLRKLALTDLKQVHGRELCRSIEKMSHLSTLELRSTSENECLDLERLKSPPSSLRCLSLKGRLISLPQWIPMLQSAVKIGLKLSKLNADSSTNPPKALQALPNLMELDLVHYNTGRELVFEVGTFKKLKILRIEQFEELNTMRVQSGAMPELKKLTISKCEKLEFRRVAIGGLTKLQELFLHDMPSEFIADLQGYRQPVAHISVIHSVNHVTGRFQNLSSG